VDSRDLDLLYRSLEMMFDHDRSATRGKLTPRGLYVFSHSNAFGAAPAHKLTERVHVARSGKSGDAHAGEPDEVARAKALDESVPRGFADYVVSVDDDGLPNGVQLTKLFS
jgi:CRISPR-associated protein Csd2